MIYLEKEPKHYWKWLIFIGFCILLIPQISLNSLTKDEAILGSIAYYFQFSNQYSLPLIQGIHTQRNFLPSLIMSFFSQETPTEFLIRFHSFLATAILTIIAIIFTRNYSQHKSSAIVAGLCIFSSIIAVKFATVGNLKILGCLFLSSSWLLLYHYGSKKQWIKAWFYSLSILTLAFLCSGITYIFYFYLPLFFMHKKTLNISRRIWSFKHLTSLITISIIFLITWFVLVYLIQDTKNFNDAINTKITILTDFKNDYLLNHYLLFPFKAILAFMPWCIFAWPIFCASYNQVEENTSLFNFLRTIVITIFLITWLNPIGRINSLLITVLPLAIMTGMHYPIIIRRYSQFLNKIIRLTFIITFIISLSLCIYYIQKITKNILSFKEIKINLILMFIAFITSSIYIFKKSKFSIIWLSFFISIILFHWCYIAYSNTNHTQLINYKKNGAILNSQIPEKTMVYNHTGKFYIRQMFYLKKPVTSIFPNSEVIHTVTKNDTYESIAFRYFGNVKLAKKLENRNPRIAENMPKIIKIVLPKEVYVIFYDKKPIDLTNNAADYNWHPISKKVKTNDNKFIQIWFGNKE